MWKVDMVRVVMFILFVNVICIIEFGVLFYVNLVL